MHDLNTACGGRGAAAPGSFLVGSRKCERERGGLWRVYVVSVEGEEGEDGTLLPRERREGEIHILFKLRARVRHLNSGVEIFSQVEIPQEAAYSIIEVLAEKYGEKLV